MEIIRNIYSGVVQTLFASLIIFDVAFTPSGTAPAISFVCNDATTQTYQYLTYSAVLSGTGASGTIAFSALRSLTLSISQVPQTLAYFNATTAYGITNSGNLWKYVSSPLGGGGVEAVLSTPKFY